jgi:hypothetical protein
VFVHAPLPLSLNFFSLSLTSEQGVHTLFTGQRERKREMKGGENERDGERKREEEEGR